MSWTDPPAITIHDRDDRTILDETNPTPFDLSPDGQWLAHVGPQNQVQLRPIGSDRPSRPLGRHERVITLAFSPDGTRIASSSPGLEGVAVIRLFDAATGALQTELVAPKSGIHTLTFDSEGQRLASGDEQGRILVWDLASKQVIQQLDAGPSWVWSIAFLDQGRKLLSEVSNGPITLYDLASGRVEAQAHLTEGVRQFVVDPAHDRAIVACNNGDLVSLSLPGMVPGHRLDQAHAGPIECLRLSPDGRLLATGGSDRHVVLRDALTIEPFVALPEWTAMVKDLAFTASGHWLAFVGADSDVALWDLTALRNGLLSAGLDWDRNAPVAAPTSEPLRSSAPAAPAVVVLRPARLDPAEAQQALDAAQAGLTAFEADRLADAIGTMQLAGA